MTPIEFHEQLEKLKQVFGEKSYTPERSTILFEYVKQCDARAFAYTVKQWIGDAKTAPLGEHFRDFARKFNSTNLNLKDPYAVPQCLDCSDTGWLTLQMRPELVQIGQQLGYSERLAILCTCRTGNVIKAKIEATNEIRDCAKQINSSYRQWYEIQNRWEKRTYGGGKSWEQFVSEKLEAIG